jgi:feruloyl esterase
MRLLLAAAVTIVAGVAAAQPSAPQRIHPPLLPLPSRASLPPAMACKALELERFDRLAEAPAELIEAREVAAGGGIAAHCLVTGYVQPQVRFQLRLPLAGYTGRYLQIGCGGNCGFVRLPGEGSCDEAMASSGAFAVAATDTGHAASPGGTLWARDNPALQKDFAERGVHVVAIAAKAITARYYGEAPDRSYFQGCSDGGREAMKEAQLFPDDFDGIVAGAPANYISTGFLRFAWQEARRKDAGWTPEAGKTLHLAVMAACDRQDGLADGQIDDPRQCAFDPVAIACPAGSTTACLTPPQVEMARAFYSGPVDASGRHLSVGGLARGSELTWAEGSRSAMVESYFGDMLYGSRRPTGVKVADIRFDAATAREVRTLGAHYDAPDPDLRRFRSAGGKMIVWEGAADPSAGPWATLHYYQGVRERLGGTRAARDTVRVFVLPGVYHCRGGTMPYQANMLGAIVRWVEAGEAPDKVLAAAAKPKGGIRTRPIYAYPVRAKYRGYGDIDAPESFRGVWPDKDPNDRFDWIGNDPL